VAGGGAFGIVGGGAGLAAELGGFDPRGAAVVVGGLGEDDEDEGGRHHFVVGCC